jgi:hypothetical protein
VGVEANLIGFTPCLIKNGYAGVSIEANLISIIPELIKLNPTGADRCRCIPVNNQPNAS